MRTASGSSLYCSKKCSSDESMNESSDGSMKGSSSEHGRLSARTAPLISVIVTVLVTFLLPHAVQARSVAVPRTRVTAAAVAEALSAQGIPTSPGQVSLLAEPFAVRPNPSLEIRSVGRWDDLRNLVELACHVPGECLPFYVFVNWPDRGSAAAAVTAFQKDSPPANKTPSSKPSAVANPFEDHGTTAVGWNQASQTHRKHLYTDPTTLRAGAHATLAIDTGELHIRVPVICLEDGSPGRKIRVESQDHKQFYLAEVVDGSSLKGTL